ncbi:DNA polymerase III subunit gamma/tau [Parvularcula maris]|uniref:DNA polymerase III subunit gamma/tau n=1 Tax=Parvularcula maris TaxID=2965077 RepID=A0A9X2RGB2_9PROT|nr:DNA polymerase III subunit gamma/tau [Parvularcula maris]
MTTTPPDDYQVLARKYRPSSFDDLLGHEVMVRTLRHAFEADRIAHAFILTGVRGVGKTTTARIMARALNYETDEVDRPTVDMKEEGKHCRAIAEGRHPDVIEMDAASRTGVDDIRELIEGVRYAPTVARYKVYIVDEVHMLTKNAFNAFLKTLEEPPPHVKFIFATTEIRKVPITVLSRCQRFDLKRFDGETLAGYLGEIADKEGVAAEEGALRILGRAAQGSVRDGLSLLDQAILSREGETIEAEAVRRMIGLADRSATWPLFTQVLKGETDEALASFRHQYDYGADPAEVLRDLLEVCHLATRVKAAGKDAARKGAGGPSDAEAAVALAEQLSVPALTRAWSLLMKALEETRSAPDPAAATEIGLIRLAYASALPTPAEVLSRASLPAGEEREGADPRRAAPEPPVPQAQKAADRPQTLAEIAALASANNDLILREEIERFVRLISLKGTKLTAALAEGAQEGLLGKLQAALIGWTGEPWDVERGDPGAAEPTLKEARARAIEEHPLVKEALKVFPGATIAKVRPLGSKE